MVWLQKKIQKRNVFKEIVCPIETGQCSTIPISKDSRLCHFYSYDAIENEKHFVLECLESVFYITPLEVSFHYYFRMYY